MKVRALFLIYMSTRTALDLLILNDVVDRFDDGERAFCVDRNVNIVREL